MTQVTKDAEWGITIAEWRITIAEWGITIAILPVLCTFEYSREKLRIQM